jgi:hypothetical protein
MVCMNMLYMLNMVMLAMIICCWAESSNKYQCDLSTLW